MKKNYRILIIDDDQDVRQSFADFFEDAEWEVATAESAEEAHDKLTESTFDGVIVDIRLPGINGDDFIREAASRSNNSIFIICTGSNEYKIPDDIRAVKTVYNNVFRKPVEDLYLIRDAIISHLDLLDNKQ